MLLNLLLWATGQPLTADYLPSDPEVEAAFFPAAGKLVLINNADAPRTATVPTPAGALNAALGAFETKILDV